MTEIEKARMIIDKTDEEMARLFEQRMDAVKAVAEYKKSHGIPIDDFAREAAIINKNAELIKNEEYRSYYINFLQNTIALSKQMQHSLIEE